MTTELKAPDANAALVPEKPAEVNALVQQTGLAVKTADDLWAAYAPFWKEMRGVVEDARRVEVTSAEQVSVMALARDYRLKLRRIRVAADNRRKQLKDESQRLVRAIDGLYNVLLLEIEPMETKLLEAEEFATRLEAKKKEDTRIARTTALTQLGADPQHYVLGEMSDEQFQKLLAATRTAKEQAEAEAKRREDERIAREKADAEERERVRAENERLKREADERAAEQKRQFEAGELRAKDLQASGILAGTDTPILLGSLTGDAFAELKSSRAAEKAERDRRAAEHKAAEEKAAAAQRKLKEAEERTAREIAELKAKQAEQAKQEREARESRERAEAEQRRAEQQKRDREHDAQLAELRRKAAEESAARAKAEFEAETARLAAELRAREEKAKADAIAAAPDRDKLDALAARVRGIELPALATDNAKQIGRTFVQQREKFAKWIEGESAKLTQLPLEEKS